MNRKILLISGVLLTLSIITIIIFNNMNNKENNIISNIKKDAEVINSNMITMMYETDAGTGIYEETKDTTWPESGYIFNNNLSGCENGGELEYNSINKTVNLLSNKSDRCYVYFDKYDGVWIDNVNVTNVTGSSVTLSVSATSENGSISTYYYAINDSDEYIESTTNPIVINDLNKLTEYKISIYCLDSTNAKSNIYEVSVSTTDESKPVINSVEVSDITSNGFTLTVNATSDVEISKYYFTIDGEGEQVGGTSTSNSFTFDTLNAGVSYSVTVFAEDINGIFSNKYTIYETTEKVILLSDWIISKYGGTQGNNGIYYHTSSLANSAGDNSYRYSGANPNNYVCFGSTASPCPSDNLYRIIGVFGSEVKLIKADYPTISQTGTGGAYVQTYKDWGMDSTYKGSVDGSQIGIYNWNPSGSNTWSQSRLNTTNLNSTYLNSLGSTWSNKIANHSWKVGGMSYSNGRSTPRTVYNYEVGSNSSSTTWSGKIGLMYVSDYGFAARNSNWGTNLSSYNLTTVRNNNWMWMGLYEWTISRDSDGSDRAFSVYNSGYVGNYTVDNSSAVRPCFYLTSSTTYVSGSGTSSDPIRLEI